MEADFVFFYIPQMMVNWRVTNNMLFNANKFQLISYSVACYNLICIYGDTRSLYTIGDDLF